MPTTQIQAMAMAAKTSSSTVRDSGYGGGRRSGRPDGGHGFDSIGVFGGGGGWEGFSGGNFGGGDFGGGGFDGGCDGGGSGGGGGGCDGGGGGGC